MFFDTHLHIVDRQALDYPWLSGAGDLNRDNLYDDYARDALRCGISNVLHMEVDVAPARINDETNYVREIGARPGSLVRGVIAACRPEAERVCGLSRTVARRSLHQGLPPRAACGCRRYGSTAACSARTSGGYPPPA